MREKKGRDNDVGAPSRTTPNAHILIPRFLDDVFERDEN